MGAHAGAADLHAHETHSMVTSWGFNKSYPELQVRVAERPPSCTLKCPPRTLGIGASVHRKVVDRGTFGGLGMHVAGCESAGAASLLTTHSPFWHRREVNAELKVYSSLRLL